MRIRRNPTAKRDRDCLSSLSVAERPSVTTTSQRFRVGQISSPVPLPFRRSSTTIVTIALCTLSAAAFTVETSPAQAQPTALAAPLPSNAHSPPQSTLYGVTCPGVGACTAVGQYFDAGQRDRGLLETFRNGTWVPRKAPLPSKGVRNSVLFTVACPTTSTCNAVGAYDTKHRGQAGLIESFSSGKWHAISAPVPSNVYRPENAGRLRDVDCPTTSSCIAIGTYDATSLDDDQGLIDAWMGGQQWTATEAPLPADADSTPSVDGRSVACGGPGSCVALFAYGITSTSGGAAIDSLSNGTWTSTEAPLPSDANTVADPHLNAVTCSSPSTCIAVGGYTNSDGRDTGLIETLSDGTWAPIETPETGGYADVSCPTSTSCIAVAASQAGSLVEMLANGTWNPVAAPLPNDASAQGGILESIACQSVTVCVASGNYSDQAGDELGLIETLSSGTWSSTAAPLPPNADTHSFMNGTACPASGSCLAVGQYDDASTGNALGVIEAVPNDS
jgi:hypothetical protein